MGISHLLEHMVFKGTERRSAQELALELEVRGGSLDAFTGRDDTSYQAHTLDADLPSRSRSSPTSPGGPLLRESDLEPERNVILEEINGVEDTPDDLVFELHAAALWPQHPYGYSILGTRETLAALSADDLRCLHQTGYYRGNFVVAAAGNVNHDQLLTVLEREGWFEGRGAEPAAPAVAPPPAVRGAERQRGARYRADPHRLRHRHIPAAGPPPLRARDSHQCLRRRDVEPAVPAGARGAGAGLRHLRVQALLPVGRAARRLHRYPARHRGRGGEAIRGEYARLAREGLPGASWPTASSSSRGR